MFNLLGFQQTPLALLCLHNGQSRGVVQREFNR
jgi:hypothetical protein